MPETPLNEQEAAQAGQEKAETEVVKVHDRGRGEYADPVFGKTTPAGRPPPGPSPFKISGGGQ